jgi:hypothetical protein
MSDEPEKNLLPNSILSALGLDPVETTTVPATIPDNPDGDYNQVRENIYNLLGDGTDALKLLKEIAYASQHPRAWEVYNQILKTLIDGNKDIMEIAKKKKELGPSQMQPTIGTMHNNIIVASSEDMFDAIKRKIKDEKDDGDIIDG